MPLLSGKISPFNCLSVHRTIHPDNMFSSLKGFIIIKTGKNSVGNLFNYQFFIGFAFFASPENAARMLFHVFHIRPGTLILVWTEGNSETGFYSLCIHSGKKFAILMPFS